MAVHKDFMTDQHTSSEAGSGSEPRSTDFPASALAAENIMVSSPYLIFIQVLCLI
ncbi:hypothetical protein DPMN_099371 [Dreissena polymorpha]|uniref:Uncharacterized protein n=1 Tax=Dreissena polymorpha TaxID=45954 RepID=A0A9D4LET4_DREPO|nr:hypothetical protein DPMN_099371 [Dreissena polymorpha]